MGYTNPFKGLDLVAPIHGQQSPTQELEAKVHLDWARALQEQILDEGGQASLDIVTRWLPHLTPLIELHLHTRPAKPQDLGENASLRKTETKEWVKLIRQAAVV